MLTPTIDAVACLLNSRAALPLDVKIEVALAFGMRLHQRDRLVERLHRADRRDRSEDLFVPDGHRAATPRRTRSGRRSSRSADPARASAASVDEQRGALGHALVDVLDHALAVPGADHRPIVTPGCVPSPTFSALAASTSRSRASACASPTGTSMLPARQRSPAQP